MLRNCVPNQHALETERLVQICLSLMFTPDLWLSSQKHSLAFLRALTSELSMILIKIGSSWLLLPFGNCIHSAYGTFSFRPFRPDTKSIQYCWLVKLIRTKMYRFPNIVLKPVLFENCNEWYFHILMHDQLSFQVFPWQNKVMIKIPEWSFETIYNFSVSQIKNT